MLEDWLSVCQGLTKMYAIFTEFAISLDPSVQQKLFYHHQKQQILDSCIYYHFTFLVTK